MQTLTQINGFARFGAAVEDAWRESCLADLPDAVAEQLLDGARQRRVVGGESFENGDHASQALVVDGLLRVYRKGLDGRQVTARYVAPGGLVGLAAVFAPAAPGLDQEPLRATTLLELRADSFR